MDLRPGRQHLLPAAFPRALLALVMVCSHPFLPGWALKMWGALAHSTALSKAEVLVSGGFGPVRPLPGGSVQTNVLD